MIATVTSDTIPVVIGIVLSAGLGCIAFFFKKWADGLGDKIDRLERKVDTLDETMSEATNAIGQLQVAAGWPAHLRLGRGR